LNIDKKALHTPFSTIFLIAVILQSCAHVRVEPPQPPFNDREISDILLSTKNQEDAVHNFFSHGRITLQGNSAEFEADALMIGFRNPFRIKLEITHYWGRPLFHILITETRLHILSFLEKKYYVADVREPIPRDLLPVKIDSNQLWALGRGFPNLSRHKRAVSNHGNQIALLNGEGEAVEVIDFQTEKFLPAQVLFPEQGLMLSFSDFATDNHIQFAKESRLYDPTYGGRLVFNIRQMAFNQTIDRSIFELDVPPDFEYIQGSHFLDTP